MCGSFFECLIALLLNPILLFAVGIITFIVGLTSRMPIDSIFPRLEKVSGFFKVAEKLGMPLRYIGLAFVAISAVWAAVLYNKSPLHEIRVSQISVTTDNTPTIPTYTPIQTNQSFPSVHLVNVGYMLGGWNPILVDLRNSATGGVAFHEDKVVKLFDVQVSAPHIIDGTYKIQVEAYINGEEPMGKTAMVELSPDINELGKIIPEDFKDRDDPNTSPKWAYLEIRVVLFDENGQKALYTEKSTIKLIETEGKSWWISPPYARLASVVYQINGGQEIKMDFGTIESEGIELKADDTLQINEIWYHSLEDGTDEQIYGMVDFKPGPSEFYPAHNTNRVAISSGVHNLIQNDPLSWKFEGTIPDEVDIFLYRNDGFEQSFVLDIYTIPIRHTSDNG